MGIIIKQSIKGTIWSYLGVIVGFITTSYLYPRYLTTDLVGLFSLLAAWAALLAKFFALGFNGVTERLFPYFRNKENGHSGFLFIAFSTFIIGFLIFMALYYGFSPLLIENNLEKSKLFSEYVFLLVPLTFFTLLFNLLDSYNKLLYDTVLGFFLNEFLQRILILAGLLIYIFGWCNLEQLVYVYVFAISVKGLIIFVLLIRRGDIYLIRQPAFITKTLKREIINVALFSLLAGIGGSIVFSIDKIVINRFLGLSETGIYAIGFYFATLIIIPSRPLLKISGTLIADAWKRNDVEYISDIYTRSCINQFIIGSFLFGGLWLNINNIIDILGPQYSAIKWVVFYVGLGYLFDMLTGANDQVIGYSRYYKISLLFLLILVVVVLISMYFLIPLMGVAGAALSIALAFLIYNLLRSAFLYFKFGIQPFPVTLIWILLIFGISIVPGLIIPRLNLYIDVFIRSLVFSVIFVSLVIVLKISPDINNLIKAYLKFKRRS